MSEQNTAEPELITPNEVIEGGSTKPLPIIDKKDVLPPPPPIPKKD